MEQFVRTVRASTFIRHNTIFFVGSLVVGALNYLYYPVLGRLLQTSAFGETQALVSLFLQLSIFLNVLGLLTINVVTNYGDTKRSDRIILELEKLDLLLSSAVLVLTILFSHFLQRYFQFNDSLPFVMLGLAVVVTVPFTFRSAYLRGKQYFGLASVVNILGAMAKLGFSVVLVLLGFGPTGAIAGIVLAQIVAFLYAALLAKRHGFSESLLGQFVRLPDIRLILPELKYALLILVGSLTITGLYSIDIVVVKHFFDAHTAGLYAGISTVARIIFFLTGSITQVLMPAVRMQQTAQQNRQVLGKSLLLLTAIGGGTVLIFWVAPGFVVGHLMGDKYLAFAALLPRLSLAIFLISILNLFVTYHMALRRYSLSLIVITGAVASFGILATNHTTLSAVVSSVLYSSVTIMALLGAWTGVLYITKRKESL